MKPTNQDKLYALSVAAGKATKDGNVEELLRIGNIMASLSKEEDIDKAKSLFDELQKLEPEGIKCEEHISSYHMELGGKFNNESAIDITHLPHDQQLYCLVCSLGGNLRMLAMANDDDKKKDADTAARNINLLLNMIARAVTRADYDKAMELVGDKGQEDEDDDDSTDAFRDFLSA